MRVEIVLIALSVVLLIIAALHEVNLLDYRAPISHSESENITWYDFVGFCPPNSEYDARVHTTIEVEVLADGILATAYFHPSRSYVFNKRTYDKNLFRHEMYHFHITEWSARMLRKNLKEADVYEWNDVRILEERYNEFEDSLQHAYDGESMHSLRLGKQREWESRVDSMLQVLDEYSNPKIEFTTAFMN
jgi:hypothetical protein